MAPQRKILGGIKWDDPKPLDRRFYVYSHGLDPSGRRVWMKSFETIGSAATFIRYHAAEMTQLTARLQPNSASSSTAPRRSEAPRGS